MMPKRATAQLPFDLEERRALHARAVVLGHFVFDVRPTVEPWRPPTTGEEPIVCPSPSATAMSVSRMEIANPLRDYNLRLADAATAVTPIEQALATAGLSKQDAAHWQAIQTAAAGVYHNPLLAPPGDLHLFVHAATDLGEFSISYPRRERATTCHRLDAARRLIERTASALIRVLRTVGPEAVLSRVAVDRQANALIFDGRLYEGLTERETTWLHFLLLGAGEWVSSEFISAEEGLKQFKVAEVSRSLAKRHPTLSRIIDKKDGYGSRIVLPLPCV